MSYTTTNGLPGGCIIDGRVRMRYGRAVALGKASSRDVAEAWHVTERTVARWAEAWKKARP